MIIFLLFLTSFLPSHSWSQEKDSDPLLVRTVEFKNSISSNENFNATFELSLPPGYHTYEDNFKVQVLEPNGFKISTLKLFPVKEWFDKFSKKKSQRYRKKLPLCHFKLKPPDKFIDEKGKIVLEITYQACTDSFCLFPKSKDITLPVTFVGTTTAEKIEELQNSVFTLDSFEELLKQSWVVSNYSGLFCWNSYQFYSLHFSYDSNHHCDTNQRLREENPT
jgi:thiol:disulfide interchange protein DsbD